MYRRFLSIVALVGAAGCTNVYSLSSAVPDSAAVLDPRLVGEWVTTESDGKSAYATVSQTEAREYRIRFIDEDGDTGVVAGRLGQLADRWLLDLSPGGDLRAIYRLEGLPVHQQVVLELSDSTISAAGFDGDSLKSFLLKRQIPILAYAITQHGDVLLTDPTPELARGLASYARRPNVLTRWTTYRRLCAQRESRRSTLECQFATSIHTGRKAGFIALRSMVREFGVIRPQSVGADVLGAAAAFFAGSSFAPDSVEPGDALAVIEGAYRPFIGRRDVFGAVAYRLTDIALRNPQLRQRALGLREQIRAAFIDSIKMRPPTDADDERLNPRVGLVGGRLLMGSPDTDGNADSREKPQHPVNVSPFRIQTHEVTNAEYRRFDPTHDVDAPADHPVANVSWYAAMAYSVWLGGSLPTEAQWEFAARGKDGRKYPWGDAPPTREKAQYAAGSTAPVGSHPSGATPEGLQDMAGNVWEWCLDLYGPYGRAELVDPLGPSSSSIPSRVLRVWSFAGVAWLAPSSVRLSSDPGHADNVSGFRVVWPPAGTSP
jgi:hypothetical protein